LQARPYLSIGFFTLSCSHRQFTINIGNTINMNANTSSVDNKIYHEEALDTLIQADYALAYAPTLALDEPHLMAAVTAEWLVEVLANSVSGAKLEKLITVDEHSGMTSRKKWSLEWNATGREAKLPASIFVKATPAEPAHREMLAVLHMHEIESKFYKLIQPEIPDLAPKAYYAASYPGGRFLILLEDLEASGCKPYWAKDNVSIDHIRAVTITLAKLHAKYWESSRLVGDLSWVRPRTRRYGWKWLSALTSDVRRVFPEKADDSIFPKELADLLQLWDQNADRVFDYFERLPRTVLHGDSHVGNTFSYPDGSAGLFDWQVMFSGHGLRDIAYFMLSAITHDMRKVHEKELFELYLETLAENGVKLKKDPAWNNYCLFVLDRWDAAIMSYVHGTYGHAKEGQLRGLRSTAGSIMDNDIQGRFEHLIQTELK